MRPPSPAWQPSRIEFVAERYSTGSMVVQVETDQGRGFLKALSGVTEPHHLAAERIGTLLARRLGLPTLTFHLFRLTDDFEVTLADGRAAQLGPAFLTKREAGEGWDGSPEMLQAITNRSDLGRIVAFDTWTRNCDRYLPVDRTPRNNPRNLFLSEEGAPDGQFLLKPIDHGCCFTCAHEITPRIAEVDNVQDGRIFGRFPGFKGVASRNDALAAADAIAAVPGREIQAIIDQTPTEWQLGTDARRALGDFLCQRAARLRQIIEAGWPPEDLFEFGATQEDGP